MCRLLLTLGNPPRSVYLAFQELAFYGKVPPGAEPGHRDGWGWAWWPPESEPRLRKGPQEASDRSCTEALDELYRDLSSVVIGHLRKASSGISRSLRNTHPFLHEGWAFAHNGTLYEPDRLPLWEAVPEGDGDSERLFLFLWERLWLAPPTERRQTLLAALGELENARWSALNFLLTDGRTAFVSCRFRDPACADYYTLWAWRGEGFLVICSEPIWGKEWKPLENGALLELHLPGG